jgi:hypothetical protein
MNGSVPSKALVAVLLAGVLCACTPVKKDPFDEPTASQQTYKPTGSHIREKKDGRRSPKNSSSSPVQDLENSPAVTIIQNQPPK